MQALAPLPLWGRALAPVLTQRTIYVNNAPFPLNLDHYNCDLCNAEIKTGATCWTQTVWLEGDEKPEAWEQEFLKPETEKAKP